MPHLPACKFRMVSYRGLYNHGGDTCNQKNCRKKQGAGIMILNDNKLFIFLIYIKIVIIFKIFKFFVCSKSLYAVKKMIISDLLDQT